MSTSSLASISPRVWSTSNACLVREAALTLVSAGCFALAALLVPAVGFDPRMVGGINVWIKPLKFLLSFGVFSATMAWLLSYLSPGGRTGSAPGRAIAAIVVFEVGVLLIQAARGTASHFNTAQAIDAAMFYGMGGGVIVLTALMLRIWFEFGDPRLELAPPLRAGIRAGLALFLVGTIPGWVMIAWGAHTIGGNDGGTGLPWVNWSVEAGDLRIAHFIGLHALQILPLWGGFLGSRGTAVDGSSDRRISIAAGLYAALIVAAFAQALAGQPLLG